MRRPLSHELDAKQTYPIGGGTPKTGVVGEGPSPLQLLLTIAVSNRGVGVGYPRSVSWDRSGTTLALGTVGNAVCLVQPGEVSE